MEANDVRGVVHVEDAGDVDDVELDNEGSRDIESSISSFFRSNDDREVLEGKR